MGSFRGWWGEAHGDAGDFIVGRVGYVFIEGNGMICVDEWKGEDERVMVSSKESRAKCVINMGTVGVEFVFVMCFWDEDVINSCSVA